MIYKTFILTLLLTATVFGQATYQDNDKVQYGKADSTITVDTSFQLWPFAKGPKDTTFKAVRKILQKRQFTIVTDNVVDTNTWRNDTLFLPVGTQVTNPDSITLTWTAPGDDGNVGTATEYDFRWSRNPITSANWASATPFAGEPLPRISGTKESWTLPALTGAYYIREKTRDEAFNWSAISNEVYKPVNQLTSDSAYSYMLFTSWNRWDGAKWVSGAQGPQVTVTVSAVVLPQGETVVINPDTP